MKKKLEIIRLLNLKRKRNDQCDKEDNELVINIKKIPIQKNDATGDVDYEYQYVSNTK